MPSCGRDLQGRAAARLLLLAGLLAGPAGPAHAAPVPTRLTAALSAPASPVGRAVAVAGTVTPAAPGQPVTLQRYRGGTWFGVARQPQSATGGFRFVVAPDAPGEWSYRVTAGPLARELPKLDVHRVFTYDVTTRGTVGPEAAGFAAEVAATYADPRGWLRSHRRFARVATGGDFTVVLAQASLVPTWSRSCSALYSCRVGRERDHQRRPLAVGRPRVPGQPRAVPADGAEPRDGPLAGPRPRVVPGPREAGAGDAAAVQGHAGLRAERLAAAGRAVGRPPVISGVRRGRSAG